MSPAIVWSTENCINSWNIIPSRPHKLFVSLIRNLVTSNNRNQLIFFKKLMSKFGPKVHRTVSLFVEGWAAIHYPTFRIRNWIWPHQITESTLQRNLIESVYFIKIRNSCWTISTGPCMNAKIFLIYNASERQSIESIHYFEIDVLIIFLTWFIVKIIHLCHSSALMITA